MNDKKDILTEAFRNRLKDYEKTVGSDLWAKIEKDLPIIPYRNTRRILFFKWTGVAAAILIAISLGVFVVYDHKQVSKSVVDHGVKEQIQQKNKEPESEQQLDESENHSKMGNDTFSIHREQIAHVKNEGKVIETPILIEDHPVVDNSIIEDNLTDNGHEKKNIQKEEDLTDKNKSSSYEEFLNAGYDNSILLSQIQKKDMGKNISYSLALGNSSSNYSFDQTDQINSPQAKDVMCFSPSSEVFYSNGYIQTGRSVIDVDYQMPISVSFLVRKHFSSDWAIESGLTYTYLGSEEKLSTLPTQPPINNIELHYMGIPLKAAYTFYENKRLSLYATGGGMVEKCIYGKQSNPQETLDIPELQWSIFGGLGMNLRLVNHLGLFIEPGAIYYFDDHSDIMTIRKDSPFNFSLQAGFRLDY